MRRNVTIRKNEHLTKPIGTKPRKIDRREFVLFGRLRYVDFNFSAEDFSAVEELDQVCIITLKVEWRIFRFETD